MNRDLASSLADWTAYYALTGGAAATLLGLLFVAVSLRLNIFHQDAVADIRQFAGFTLGTFLTALAIAALVLAPHLTAATLALPLFLAGLLGIASVTAIARIWMRLNFSLGGRHVDHADTALLRQGLLQMVFMAVPYFGLPCAAVLVALDSLTGLGLLAILEAALLALGTYSSWLLLSHAGS
jgi:hypothetical protein